MRIDMLRFEEQLAPVGLPPHPVPAGFLKRSSANERTELVADFLPHLIDSALLQTVIPNSLYQR